MENKKKIGIWMDYSTAELIDLNHQMDKKSIESDFTYETEKETLNRSESIMHNKEQQMNEAYYKELGNVILNYDHVLLFGPTNAKSELHNFLNKDLHFKDIQIDVKTTDKMTDNEKHAFVSNHFKK